MTESGPVTYRSVSQVRQYLREMGGCGYRYYLSRRVRAWDRPDAWRPQGTAVHRAAEEWELSGRKMPLEAAQDVFRESYADEVNGFLEGSPNADAWWASGPYKGPRDIERRYAIGLQQVARYVEYYTETAPQEVPWRTPDGKPAVELEFRIDLAGVEVRGLIDVIVMVKPVIPPPRTASGALSKSKAALADYEKARDEAKPRPIPRDNKSGKKPGDAFQLAVYDLEVEELTGQRAFVGDYWMGDTGKPTKPYDLAEWDRARIADVFQRADEGIRAEEWTPNPGPACERCGVATSCPFRFSG